MANSNYLFGHAGTSYSETASSWGLGPAGIMERYDVVGNDGNVVSFYRRDWAQKNCPPVGAANKTQSEKCPNYRNLF